MKKVLIVLMILLVSAFAEAALVRDAEEKDVGVPIWLKVEKPVNVLDNTIVFEGSRHNEAKITIEGRTEIVEVGGEEGIKGFKVKVLEIDQNTRSALVIVEPYGIYKRRLEALTGIELGVETAAEEAKREIERAEIAKMLSPSPTVRSPVRQTDPRTCRELEIELQEMQSRLVNLEALLDEILARL